MASSTENYFQEATFKSVHVKSFFWNSSADNSETINLIKSKMSNREVTFFVIGSVAMLNQVVDKVKYCE